MNSTKDKAFLDTNVVVYAFDDADPGKQGRAWKLLQERSSEGRVAISTQVLQEFYVTVVHKLPRPLPAAVAERAVIQLARLHVHQVDTDTVLAAIALSRERQLSFWDALIVQAALESGCALLYSEDFQDGLQIDNLHVSNPFA